ncbi:MAG: multi-sensor signal transduction histidine kinase [uncultured bacterium]|nr:MAG: multi-sensor signal transduction histidine kinase [uncultured bacterium]HBY73150.1 hypothetical protein [Candidatus Kerfeldbacteria bacterium]
MFDTKTALLLIVTIANVVIGLTVFIRQRHSSASLAFVFFTLGISLWAFTNAVFQFTSDRTLGIIMALLSYYAGILIALPFYAFSRNFPEPLPRTKQKQLTQHLWIYGLMWGVIITIPDFTLRDVIYDPVGRIITGPGLFFHFASIIIFVFAGMWLLWRKHTHAELVEQKQIRIILIGALLTTLAGMTFNLLLPLFDNYSLVWLGPDFTLILVACMAYAIVRHGLFDIRIITAELFTAALGLVLVIELLRAQTNVELGIRAGMLLIFLYIGHRLLQSVYAEIKAKEALKKLLDAKTDFIHAASHQLRTPLSGIRGMLTMLFEGDYDTAGPGEKEKAQHHVLLATERLVGTVNDLLYAAEVEQGMVSTMEPGQVEPLVQQSIETLRANFIKKGLILHCQLPTLPLPPILMRANFLQQVFLNLIDNAERYTPVPGEVTVELSTEHDSIIFQVRDTGIGLTPADEEKLFTRFGRSTMAKNIQPNGSGLGLYIVKRIVEEHGGTITAHSLGRNQGTTFRVTLPII